MLAMVDLDGTLVNTNNINYFAYKEACEKYGYDVGYEQYCKEWNGLNYKIFLKQLDPKMSPEVMQQIHDDKKELYKKYIKNGALNTPLIEMLKGLKSRKWKIALVSAASKVNINNILEYFKITDVFDIIVGQEDVVETKPSPECYIKTMQHFDEIPSTCIVFEDSKTGIEAAMAAGINYYIVRGYN
jgi:HAD superfamily hydrolase (TIGR01509 family)